MLDSNVVFIFDVLNVSVPAVLVIGFSQAQYTTTENALSFSVSVAITSGVLAEDLTLIVSFGTRSDDSDDSATGIHFSLLLCSRQWLSLYR